jgi:hypothetical protein
MTSPAQPEAPLVTCGITVSVDGFAAGPRQSQEHPLGEGGERLHIAPITLGAGERLFDGVDLALEPVEARNTDLVTHVRYRVLR